MDQEAPVVEAREIESDMPDQLKVSSNVRRYHYFFFLLFPVLVWSFKEEEKEKKVS